MTTLRNAAHRALTAAALVAAAAFLFAACASAPPQGRPPGAVYVSANQLVFVESRVDAPANQAFQLYFENLEAIPHNVHVVTGTGASIARGEIFTGPSAQILEVPALAPGTYKLLCDIHPDMQAELVAD